jgi:glycine/D-amino acid oxidase-like deaminating enzyme
MIAPADSEAKPKDIVIIGGGVIGICTAYYLLTTGTSNVTLVETHEVAGAASGKAGGFLALDWHGPATNDLAALSWRLHKELAKEHDGENKWGYRLLDSVSYTCRVQKTTCEPSTGSEDNLAPKPNPALEGSDMRPRPPAIAAEVDQSWINDGGETNVLGTMASTAQVYVPLWSTARSCSDDDPIPKTGHPGSSPKASSIFVRNEG